MPTSRELNQRVTPNGDIEGRLRRELRDLLNLDIFTRDEQILDRVRELVQQERAGRHQERNPQ